MRALVAFPDNLTNPVLAAVPGTAFIRFIQSYLDIDVATVLHPRVDS